MNANSVHSMLNQIAILAQLAEYTFTLQRRPGGNFMVSIGPYDYKLAGLDFEELQCAAKFFSSKLTPSGGPNEVA